MKYQSIAYFLAFFPALISASYSNEPAQVPIPGKFMIRCQGLKYDDGKKVSAAFFIDPAHNILKYQVELQGAPLAKGEINVSSQVGTKTEVAATDFYGNGQILDFAGRVSKPKFIPAYNPPASCPRCQPGWPAHYVYQNLIFAGIEIYQAYPYTSKAYTAGSLSYPQANGSATNYAFKTATCEINHQQ